MRLPPAVRAAALAALGGSPLQKEAATVSDPTKGLITEFAWMSWAGTVWRLQGENGAVYVKRAGDLKAEHDRTVWLAGRLPVPEVLGLFRGFGDDWLLTRAARGVPLSNRALGWEPKLVAQRLGEILRDIHAVDVTGCPFGEPKRGHVLVHGDYCLPNVLVENGRLSALIDLGLAGLGDPQVDLAAGVWTLQYNFGPGLAREFLDAYGWPPMSDRAIERLRRRYSR